MQLVYTIFVPLLFYNKTLTEKIVKITVELERKRLKLRSHVMILYIYSFHSMHAYFKNLV